MIDYCNVNLPNLKKWYGQNVNCISEKVESIPIGLENTKNWTKFSKKEILLKYLKEKETEIKNLVLEILVSGLTHQVEQSVIIKFKIKTS
jgi:hypothetical protein